MADYYVPSFDDEDEIAKTVTADMSKSDDLADVEFSSNLSSLLARFGVAEEDESIREEGFELAQKGGLIRKPRPESTAGYYMSGTVDKRDEIKTDSESELSRVFDSAKSEFDSESVDFRDLSINAPAVEEKAEESKPEEQKPVEKAAEAEPEKKPESPKRKRGRPKKNQSAEPVAEEKKEAPKQEPVITEEDDTETTEIVKKFNTHTKVIFVDETLEDGIKRNSDEELEDLFAENSGRRKSWFRRKK